MIQAMIIVHQILIVTKPSSGSASASVSLPESKTPLSYFNIIS